MLVNGKKIADNIIRRLHSKVVKLKKAGTTPRLGIILVGNDHASLTYIRKKQEAGKKIGVSVQVFKMPTKVSTKQVISKIKSVQKQSLSGIIVQLPLPRKLDVSKILNAIKPELDIDLMTYTTWGQLAMAENRLEPPTPAAILEILRHHKINLQGKHIVVVGRGWLIGKPMANLLMQQPVTLTICGKSTRHLGTYTRQADIVITAVGKYNLITGAMIKRGAIVIDAGFTSQNGKLAGDVNVADVSKKARLITPTPGGVGPITVAKLMANVVANCEFLLKRRR